MSGPKYNRYRMLEAKRRELLKLQIQKELYNKENVRVNKLIIAENDGITVAKRQIDKQKEVTLKNIKTYLNNIKIELEKLKNNSDTIIAINDDSILKFYNEYYQIYQNLVIESSYLNNTVTLKELDKYYQKINNTFFEICNYNITSLKKVKQKEKQLKVDLSNKLNDNLARYGYIDFLNHNDFDVSSYINTINELATNDKLNVSLKNNVLEIIKQLKTINNPKTLRDFCLGIVSQIINECQNYLNLYNKDYQEFIDLFNEYQNLCLVLHEKSQYFEFSKENLNKLKDLNKQYRCIAEDELERQYIASAFNDILIEMGYNLLGQKSKSLNSKTFYCNRIYSYNNGNVASVVFSSDGQISIEIGKLKNNANLTNQEIDLQIKSMEKLCEDLPIIEQKLQEKGIYLNERILMQPVDKEFAQTFNANEFNIKQAKDAGEYLPIDEEILQYMEDEEWL